MDTSIEVHGGSFKGKGQQSSSIKLQEEYDPYKYLQYDDKDEEPSVLPNNVSSMLHTVSDKPRKLTPVYADFPTAYSSIRSGKSKRYITPSVQYSSGIVADTSAKPVLLEATASAISLPRSPASAMIRKNSSTSSMDFQDAISSTIPPLKLKAKLDLPTPHSSFRFSNLRKVLLGRASPAPKPLLSPQWPHDICDPEDPAANTPIHEGQRFASNFQIHALATSSADGQSPLSQTRGEHQIYNSSPYLEDDTMAWPLRDQDVADKADGLSEGEDGYPDVERALMDYYLPDSSESSDPNIDGTIRRRQLHLQEITAESPPYGPYDNTLRRENSTIANIVEQYSVNSRAPDTLDNIIGQYGQRDRLVDLSLDSGGEESECDDASYFRKGAQPRAPYSWFKNSRGIPNVFRRQHQGANRSSDKVSEPESRSQVPNISLPKVPSGEKSYTSRGMSDNDIRSSSYGDTRNLLQLTQRTNLAEDDRDMAAKIGSLKSLEAGTPPPTIPQRNPYRLIGQHRDVLLYSTNAADDVPQASDLNAGNTGHDSVQHLSRPPKEPRLRKEREVSVALHRLSYQSAGSQPLSDASNLANEALRSSTGSADLIRYMGHDDQRPPLTPPEGNDQEGFYHRSVIPPTWVGSQQANRVRIPINRIHTPETTPDSIGHTFLEDADNLAQEQDDDANDWETVGTGLMSRIALNPYSGIGGINHAGSSRADGSDDGSISPKRFARDDFASTDRITQHPAQTENSHEYRLREINDGSLPMLLPVYNQIYRVNGYPTNSSRVPTSRPIPQSSYQSPLAKAFLSSHANPFKSSPPEVMTRTGSVGKPSRNGEAIATDPNYRNSSDQDSLTNLNDKHLLSPSESMGSFGGPGPAIKHVQNDADAEDSDIEENPFHDRFIGEQPLYNYSSSGHRTAGSSIADESTESFESLDDRPVRHQTTQDGPRESPDTKIAHERARNTNIRNWRPFIHGPPGAFYRDVRSVSEGRSSEKSQISFDPIKPRDRNSGIYPTNQMRPLSLLTVCRPNTPIGLDGNNYSKNHRTDEFIYRSPLAPIESRSWRTLYSTRQLLSFGNHAQASVGPSDIDQAGQSFGPVYGERPKPDRYWKRYLSNPRMFAWARDSSSIKTDVAGRKAKISLAVLIACCLFPPTLVLYSLGYMDSLMICVTNGEITHFGRKHKKAAGRLAWAFFTAALVALVVALVVRRLNT